MAFQPFRPPPPVSFRPVGPDPIQAFVDSFTSAHARAADRKQEAERLALEKQRLGMMAESQKIQMQNEKLRLRDAMIKEQMQIWAGSPEAIDHLGQLNSWNVTEVVDAVEGLRQINVTARVPKLDGEGTEEVSYPITIVPGIRAAIVEAQNRLRQEDNLVMSDGSRVNGLRAYLSEQERRREISRRLEEPVGPLQIKDFEAGVTFVDPERRSLAEREAELQQRVESGEMLPEEAELVSLSLREARLAGAPEAMATRREVPAERAIRVARSERLAEIGIVADATGKPMSHVASVYQNIASNNLSTQASQAELKAAKTSLSKSVALKMRQLHQRRAQPVGAFIGANVRTGEDYWDVVSARIDQELAELNAWNPLGEERQRMKAVEIERLTRTKRYVTESQDEWARFATGTGDKARQLAGWVRRIPPGNVIRGNEQIGEGQRRARASRELVFSGINALMRDDRARADAVIGELIRPSIMLRKNISADEVQDLMKAQALFASENYLLDITALGAEGDPHEAIRQLDAFSPLTQRADLGTPINLNTGAGEDPTGIR